MAPIIPNPKMNMKTDASTTTLLWISEGARMGSFARFSAITNNPMRIRARAVMAPVSMLTHSKSLPPHWKSRRTSMRNADRRIIPM